MIGIALALLALLPWASWLFRNKKAGALLRIGAFLSAVTANVLQGYSVWTRIGAMDAANTAPPQLRASVLANEIVSSMYFSWSAIGLGALTLGLLVFGTVRVRSSSKPFADGKQISN